MDLHFPTGIADAYKSSRQQVRILSERSAASSIYCPNCGNPRILQYPNNKPVADLFCAVCHEDNELKSQRKRFGARLVDGAYPAMIGRLTGNFFTADMIEERKPLPATAKRAGWVGCRILLQSRPHAGRIDLIRDGKVEPKADVLQRWKRTLFPHESMDLTDIIEEDNGTFMVYRSPDAAEGSPDCEVIAEIDTWEAAQDFLDSGGEPEDRHVGFVD